MKLKQTLKDKDFFKPSNGNYEPLSHLENQLIVDFINELLDEDNCQLIFRGEAIEYAYFKSGIDKRYNDRSDEFQFNEHGKSIFYIGAKADSYLFKFDEVDFPIDLNNADPRLFHEIFSEFNKNIDHPKLRNEAGFIKYHDADSTNFVTKIMSLEKEERIRIKYYYLWLLHVIGDTKYKGHSNFLSTTKNYEKAAGFGHDEMVYVGWIPRPIKNRSVYIGSLIQMGKRLNSIDLPTYSDEPYPDENEISLIGGFFPHYILGIYHLQKGIILINNNLLETSMLRMIESGQSQNIINYGIGIDQSNFRESKFFQISKYKRHLTYIQGDGYYDNI